MENSSDLEDIIPPTPEIPFSKLRSRTKKARIPKTNSSKTVSENPASSFKRKRIISPDMKVVKQNSKQLTLFNFLLKANKPDQNSSVGAQSNVCSPVKINLSSKLDVLCKVGNSSDTVLKESSNAVNVASCSNKKVFDVEGEYLKESDCIDSSIAELSVHDRLSDRAQKPCVSTVTESVTRKPGKTFNDRLRNLITHSGVKKGAETVKDHSLFPQPSHLAKSESVAIVNNFPENCDKDLVPPGPKTESGQKCPSDINSSEIFTVSCEDEVMTSDRTCPASIAHTDNAENEICEEVASLQFNSEKNDPVSNEEVENNQASSNVVTKELSCKNFEYQAFVFNEASCTDEFDWENDKAIFDESFNISHLDAPSNNQFIHSELQEGRLTKFKVINFQRNVQANEVLLHVAEAGFSDRVYKCLLKGFWADSGVVVGDLIHILKPSFNTITTIDNDAGFLVINPDFLISSTSVVSTLFCMRKAVLNYILPQWSSGNNVMMIGSLIHEIFQKSVNSHATTHEDVENLAKLVLKRRENLISLCCQDLSENEVQDKIQLYIPNILHWIKTHCSFRGKNSFQDVSITKILDIEENVWSPKYGIKGKIDMTVKACCPNQSQAKVMPLELKTGRPSYSAEHIGQVSLYSLMMEERLKQTSDGLLLYLRDKAEMKVIPSNHHSKRGLIQLRNELGSFVSKWVSAENSSSVNIEECYLPKPINNQRLCNKCPYLLPCSVYQKAFKEEKTLVDSHAMKKLGLMSINHLSSSHMEYFLHWSRLLLLETTTTAEVKAFWTEDPVTREKRGMCLSSLVLDKSAPPKSEKGTEYYLHTFLRSPTDPDPKDFSSSCFKEADYVAVSNQNNSDEVAIAMGYIVVVAAHFIVLAIERNLGNLPQVRNCVFRVDKIVSNSATSSIRNTLMLFMLDDGNSERLRKLIIDLESPRFLTTLPKQIVLMGRDILKGLNKNQQKAVLKAMMAEDYFLIKGMPGTGKTSTIVALVRLLVKKNASVLLASYTHSAIDNILLKLKDYVEFVRIGPKYRIHPDLLQYSFESLTEDYESVDQFSSFMKEKKVVATTCLGINHAIFKLRKFDYCIVDEAAQINQVACLGPLFLARKFILVGDDKQLPPLVLNPKARENGMLESLFLRLQNPSNCLELTMQYRMNQEIMRLCNELTYQGHLQCGSDVIANAVLQLPAKADISPDESPWLLSALDSSLNKSVVFINTDHFKNSNADANKQDVEADLVIQLLEFLSKCHVPDSDVGVIAPYRKQVELIQKKLKLIKIFNVEVNTVDQYQGRDKSIIIVSCVRPGDTMSEQTGVILDDERRLNVAITRAKTKLILIGSRSVLSNYKPFLALINCLRPDQFLEV